MARILHLTDLHLAPIERDDVVGDYKESFVPLAERQRRVEALRSALREFADAHSDELDAVVVSGDITVSGAESGYEMFSDMLAELEPALPPRAASSSFQATTT